MELTLQSFLRFLRNLVSLFHKRWDHLARKLWHIFSIFRSRFSSRHPKRADDVRRRTRPRSEKPSPTTAICASRLPPRSPPIVGGDSPVIPSPSPISIEVRQPTILNPEDILEESRESNTERLDADGYFLGGSRQISGSPDFTGYHDEPDPIRVVLPSDPGDSTSTSPVTPSRPNSRPSSRYSYRPPSQYAAFGPGYRPESQYSHPPPSEYSYHSPSNLNGAESAARGYLPERPSPRPSSPALSVRTPSVAGSVTSRVYRASRPITRVRRPSPMTNAPRRSPTPASVRQSVHETHTDGPVPELPQPESHTTGSVHRERNSVAGPSLSPPLNGKLRPAVGINRYEKQQAVIIEEVDKNLVCPPVTTQFLWSVFVFPNRTSNIHLRYVPVSLLPKTGSPSCIPRALCTGSTRRM